MSDRASRYARISRAKGGKRKGDSLILAHIRRTPTGRLRLVSVGIVLEGDKESIVAGPFLESDPTYVAVSEYAIRKMAHDIVKSSGRYTKFYDKIVKLVFELE
jgi:hypothetical protein